MEGYGPDSQRTELLAREQDPTPRSQECQHFYRREGPFQNRRSQRFQGTHSRFYQNSDRNSLLLQSLNIQALGLRRQKRYLVARLPAVRNDHWQASFFGQRYSNIIKKNLFWLFS